MRRLVRWSLGLSLALFLAFLFWPEAKAGPTGAWLKAAGLEARFETVEGLRIRYVMSGKGPAAVLLHRFSTSIYNWKDVLAGLPGTLNVSAPELPSFGDSNQS